MINKLVSKLTDLIPAKKPAEYRKIGNEIYSYPQEAITAGAKTWSSQFQGKTWKQIDQEREEKVYAVVIDRCVPVGNWSEPVEYRNISKRYRKGAQLCKLLKPMRVCGVLYAGDYCEVKWAYFSEIVRALEITATTMARTMARTVKPMHSA